jgi:MFS family permease
MELRGLFGETTSLGMNIFVLVSQVLGIFMSYHPGWRILISFGFLISMVQLILLPFVQTSPRWLIHHHRDEAGHKALNKLRGKESLDEYDRIRISIAKAERSAKKVSFWKRLGSLKFLKNLTLMTFLYLMQPFTGANIVGQYSTDIFNATGMNIASVATAITGVCNILAGLFSLLIVDHVGRRKLLVFGLLGQTISFGVLSAAYILTKYASWISWFSLVGVLGYLIFYAFALGSLISLLLTELFPEDLEQFGVTFTSSINWLGCGVSTFIFPLLVQWLGEYVFLPFFVLNLLTFIVIVIFVPETGSRSLEDLQASFGLQLPETEFEDFFAPEPTPMKEQFVKFLTNELDVDPFRFAEKVVEYKGLPSISRRVFADDLYNTYVNPTADHDVLLPQHIIDDIQHKIETMDFHDNASAAIFNEALQELKDNQLLDSYLRMKNLVL